MTPALSRVVCAISGVSFGRKAQAAASPWPGVCPHAQSSILASPSGITHPFLMAAPFADRAVPALLDKCIGRYRAPLLAPKFPGLWRTCIPCTEWRCSCAPLVRAAMGEVTATAAKGKFCFARIEDDQGNSAEILIRPGATTLTEIAIGSRLRFTLSRNEIGPIGTDPQIAAPATADNAQPATPKRLPRRRQPASCRAA